MARLRQHSYCTVLRHKTLRHGTINMNTGAFSAGEITQVTEPCNTPLFHEAERASGVCRSCADGWEVPGNRPASQAERAAYKEKA